MRVLFISQEVNLGGASKAMLSIIDNLSDRVEYFVAVPFLEGELIDELKKRNIEYIYYHKSAWMLSKPQNYIKWLFCKVKYMTFGELRNYSYAKKLKIFTEKKRIDLIHTNVSTINIGAILCKLTGLPHIWHIREFGIEDHGMYPRTTEKRIISTIENYSSEVIAVSEAVADKYRKKLDKRKPIVIYDGVSQDNYISAEYRKSARNEEVNFLISGALHPGKGQQIAVRAVNLLLSEGITGFRLYIAGRGDEEWLTNIDGFSTDHIEYLGRVNDMPKLRKNMDIELVCSRCEGFGLVTAEAMLGCMPVIGSDSGATPELIVNGETGFLYELNNAEDLAKKMKYFIFHKDKIIEFGEKGQRRALECFTDITNAERIYTEYMKILRGLCNEAEI